MEAVQAQTEFVVTVALLVVATVKIKATSREELRAKMDAEFTTEQDGRWALDRFKVEEADVRVGQLAPQVSGMVPSRIAAPLARALTA